MKRIAVMTLAALAVLAAPAVQAKPKITGEQKLAKILEGREAGEPVSYLPVYETRDVKVIDKTALVYGSGRTVYVNRPTNPESLDSNDVLVTNLRTSQLCRMDIVRLHDRSPGFFFTGTVGLTEFVPYRKLAAK